MSVAPELIITAFIIGLMGAGHCLGMCGGIAAALSFAIPNSNARSRVLVIGVYNVGRISSYTLMGFILGVAGQGIAILQPDGFPVLRFLAALMLVLMGFYISGWWRILATLEKIGVRFWRLLQPLGEKFLPVRSLSQALFLGFIWGWLPCGLVYSALVYALAQGDPISAAVVMLSFGLGTMPAIFVGGVAGDRLKSLLQKKSLRAVMGMSLIIFGLVSLVFMFQHLSHHSHDNSHNNSNDYNEQQQMDNHSHHNN